MSTVTRTTCPDCAGRGYTSNPSTHDDSKCGRCQGVGLVDASVAERINAQRNAAMVVEALTKRAYKAFDEGDDETATLLRKACQLIREGSAR